MVGCDVSLLLSLLVTSREEAREDITTLPPDETSDLFTTPLKGTPGYIDTEDMGGGTEVGGLAAGGAGAGAGGPLWNSSTSTPNFSSYKNGDKSSSEKGGDKNQRDCISPPRGQMQRHFNSDLETIHNNYTMNNKELKRIAFQYMSHESDHSMEDNEDDIPPFSAGEKIENSFCHLVVESPLFHDLLRRHSPVFREFRF